MLQGYLYKVENLDGTELKGILKRFFDSTNTYRNEMKRLSEEEYNIVKLGIKVHPVHSKKDFKRMVYTDYPQIIRSFEQEDTQLRKRFALLFNSPKSKK